VGDGGAQQVDPYDLRRAAEMVRDLARSFNKDGVEAFRSGMRNYSLAVLDQVAAERGKRIRGQDYDKSIAEQPGLQHVGATSDWVNPFGRFTEADRLQAHVDQAHQAALRDGASLVTTLRQLAGALDAAASYYEQNEGKNAELSKKVMQQLLTGTSRKA